MFVTSVGDDNTCPLVGIHGIPAKSQAFLSHSDECYDAQVRTESGDERPKRGVLVQLRYAATAPQLPTEGTASLFSSNPYRGPFFSIRMALQWYA